MQNGIGLALGGGGIKGLSHVGTLRLFDRYGLKPDLIAGTSMGAIIAALYARGLSAEQIESRVLEHLYETKAHTKGIFKKRKHLLTWAKIFRYENARGGILSADGLFTHLFGELNGLTFDDLDFPFVAVATDLHSGKQHLMNSGDVVSAIRASIAVPGIFAPVERDGLTLVDGGLVNNLPSNVIKDCRIRIASDVISFSKEKDINLLNVVNEALNIMVWHTTQLTLQQYPVDLHLKIDTSNIDAFNVTLIKEAIQNGNVHSELFDKEFIALFE